MPKLEYINTVGQLFLNKEGTRDKHNIGSGRLSIIEKEDFCLLNFWIVTEYRVIYEDGTMTDTTGPILEVLTKIDSIPAEGLNFQVIFPEWEDCKDEWDENYRTGYYNGFHQRLSKAELQLIKIGHNFEIAFKCIPAEESETLSIDGNCELPLSDKMERFW